MTTGALRWALLLGWSLDLTQADHNRLRFTSHKVTVAQLENDQSLNGWCEQYVGASFRAADFTDDLKKDFTEDEFDAFLDQNNVPIDPDIEVTEIIFVANHGREVDPGNDHGYYMMKRVGADYIFHDVYPDDFFGDVWVHAYPRSYGGLGKVLCIKKPNSPTDEPSGKENEPPVDPQKPVPSTDENPVGSSFGDPHIQVWNGDVFDFHGGCDLVLMDNPNFANGLGISVHIRTRIRTWWSYIDTAVLRIGTETLEVMGGVDHGNPFLFCNQSIARSGMNPAWLSYAGTS